MKLPAKLVAFCEPSFHRCLKIKHIRHSPIIKLFSLFELTTSSFYFMIRTSNLHQLQKELKKFMRLDALVEYRN